MICGISKIDLDVPYVGEDGGREIREGEERAIRSVVGEVDGIFMQIDADLRRKDSGGSTKKEQGVFRTFVRNRRARRWRPRVLVADASRDRAYLRSNLRPR